MVVSAIATLVIGGIGLIASLVANAFFLDKFDAYGEVRIPGSASLQLPAGEVTASFHTVVTGSSGSGLPVPDLKLSIVGPIGRPDSPEVAVKTDFGASTIVNNDARVRVWTLQVPEGGTYRVATDGDVNGYISPRLAFGHGSSYGWLTWMFAVLLAAGAVELTVALLLSARSAKRARPLTPQELGDVEPPTWDAGLSAVPTDQAIRLQQLKQLAALRDSGALTEDEFEAEKRRILEN
jgi:hypothetical protein